ncbi:MAG: A24 family peptidase [Gemmatimonadetes bacterium]|nr:A24 family peptidase [Gemmatimonadota bacterium]
MPPDLLSVPLPLPVLTAAAVMGASVGSFLNVCITRWPAEESVVRPRSRCPRCGRAIAWHENIPVVSWLLLRGRCRGCQLPISLQYPAVELLVAAGWLACVLAFGVGLEALRVAVFGTILLGVAVTDARHYLIPDGYTVTGLLAGVVGAVASALTGGVTHFAGPWEAVLGACVGAGAITIIGWLAEVVLRREAMGFGDSTLMAMVGAAVGPARALLTILVGAFVGAMVFLLLVGPVAWVRARRRGEPFAFPEVPFGVFLAPAALLALLWGTPLLTWYVARTFPA